LLCQVETSEFDKFIDLCRLEKEKGQQKGELEELRGQVEHLTKAKVSS